MEHLKKLGKIVYLHIDYKHMCRRISNLSSRGVVLKNGRTLRDMYNERLPLYQKWADVVIDCNNNTVEQTARAIAQSL
jgi:shikimate kinase